mgnify:FL=1
MYKRQPPGAGRWWTLGAQDTAADWRGLSHSGAGYTQSDETRMTLCEMGRHGMHHVRGGIFLRVTLLDAEQAAIRAHMITLARVEACFNCGKLGVRAASPHDCPSPVVSAAAEQLLSARTAYAVVRFQPVEEDAALANARRLGVARARAHVESAAEFKSRVLKCAMLLRANVAPACAMLVRSSDRAGSDELTVDSILAADPAALAALDVALLERCGLRLSLIHI